MISVISSFVTPLLIARVRCDLELLRPVGRDQRRERDQAAVALRQARALPQVAIDDIVGVVDQRRHERLDAVALGGRRCLGHVSLPLLSAAVCARAASRGKVSTSRPCHAFLKDRSWTTCPNTSCSRSAMRCARRGARTISSAAIRTTRRWRWTISSGSRRARSAPSSSTPASPRRSRRSAGARYLRDPIEALKLVGVDADTVQDVILTHLHYDHVGNFHRFPAAQFHLQEPEMHYAIGRHMRYPRLVAFLRGRGRRRHGAAELRQARDVLQWRRRACARHHAASGRRPLDGAAVRARAHQARLGGGRLRHHAFLREHDDRPPVHHGVPHRADAGSLRYAAGAGADAAAHRAGPRPAGDEVLSAADARACRDRGAAGCHAGRRRAGATSRPEQRSAAAARDLHH